MHQDGGKGAHQHRLGDVCLHIQHRTQIQQHIDNGRVGGRAPLLEERHIPNGSVVSFHMVAIFQTDRQTMQRSYDLLLALEIVIQILGTF